MGTGYICCCIIRVKDVPLRPSVAQKSNIIRRHDKIDIHYLNRIYFAFN